MIYIKAIQFTRITLGQRDAVNRIRAKYRHTLSAWHAFHSLFLWQNALRLTLHLEEELFAVKYGLAGENCYFMPCGAPNAVNAFLADLREQGGFRLFFLRSEDVRLLSQTFPSAFRFRYDRNSSEYLYDIDAGCLLKGKDYRNIRHKLQKIRNQHRITAEPLTADSIPAAEEIVRKWQAQKCLTDNSVLDDVRSSRCFFNNMLALSARGTIISLDGVPSAVAAGIPLSETVFDFCIHKQISNDRGLGTLSYQMLMQQLRGQYLLLNAEEDMGMAGLRLNKQEMKPCRMNRMWEAVYGQE